MSCMSEHAGVASRFCHKAEKKLPAMRGWMWLIYKSWRVFTYEERVHRDLIRASVLRPDTRWFMGVLLFFGWRPTAAVVVNHMGPGLMSEPMFLEVAVNRRYWRQVAEACSEWNAAEPAMRARQTEGTYLVE